MVIIHFQVVNIGVCKIFGLSFFEIIMINLWHEIFFSKGIFLNFIAFFLNDEIKQKF